MTSLTHLFFLAIVVCFLYQRKSLALDDSQCIVISIGHTCATSNMIKFFGLRYRSFPFDWLITDLNGIIRAFDNNFDYLLDKRYLKDISKCTPYIDPIPGRIGNTSYNFFFIHDFGVKLDDPHIEDQLKSAKERFKRRIDRLYGLIESGKKVVLIRWNNCVDAGKGVTKDSYIQLREMLNNKFPNNRVTIITVDQLENYTQNWGLKRIKSYYMPYHKTSSDAHPLWVPILKEHNLI